MAENEIRELEHLGTVFDVTHWVRSFVKRPGDSVRIFTEASVRKTIRLSDAAGETRPLSPRKCRVNLIVQAEWTDDHCFRSRIRPGRGCAVTSDSATHIRGPVTSVLRFVGPVVAVLGATAMLLGYTALPETVPTHFDGAGQADEYGPRWNVLVLAAVWILLQLGIAFLATKPKLFNFPVPVTDENQGRLYREGERMLVWVGLALATCFAGIALLVFDLPGSPLVVVGVVATFATTIVGIVRVLRAS